MADIGGGSSGGGLPFWKKDTQYSVSFNSILTAIGKTTADLPLTLKVCFVGTYNNVNVYDNFVIMLNNVYDTQGTNNKLFDMAKSSSVKAYKYANGFAVAGTSNDDTKANGEYLITAY